MISDNTIGKRNAAISLLFLLVYALTIFVYPVHNLSHESEKEVVCYEEDNACHLRLVHNDAENGCDHDSHFADETADCELCPLLELTNETELANWSYVNIGFPPVVENTLYLESAAKNSISYSFSRGPPRIS